MVTEQRQRAVVDYSNRGGDVIQRFVGKEETGDEGGAGMKMGEFVEGGVETGGQTGEVEGYDFARDSGEDANNILYISYDGVIDEETLSNLVNQLSNQEFPLMGNR